MVGRTRYRLPLNGSLERKFSALEERLALRVLASAPRGASGGDGTFALQRGTPIGALDGPVFYGTLPVRIARELRHRPADVILAQSPYEALAALAGRKLARSDAAVVVEIHGDWRTWSRLYGSRARAGGMPVVVRDGEDAILGAPDSPASIADALVRLLTDRALAERLGAAGRRFSSEWTYTPEEYADSVVELVGRAVEARRA
jgi:hypothetical protein